MPKNNNNDDQFWVFVAISVALHLFIFVLFTYGLPSLFKSPPEPQVVTFEVLPIDAISNIKTQKVQKEKEIEEESAKKVQKTKQEEAPDPKKEDNAKAEENKEESKRDFDEKKPDDKRELVSIKSAEDKKKKEEKKKSDKAQEKQVKDDKKPKKKKLPTEKEMDALLKTLEKASEGKDAKSNKRAVGARSDAKEESMGQYNEDKPLSISEEQAIRQQIERNWNVPIGVQNAGDIIITLYIAIKIDGTVSQVKLVDSTCGADAVACRAASDSAVRAVWQASPMQNLPAERYDSWKEVKISFDPRDVLGM